MIGGIINYEEKNSTNNDRYHVFTQLVAHWSASGQ